MPSRQHSSMVARTLCDAAAMALDARQAALLGPAAVAVHDDGDVPRQPLRIEAGAAAPRSAAIVVGGLNVAARHVVSATSVIVCCAVAGRPRSIATGRPSQRLDAGRRSAAPPPAGRASAGECRTVLASSRAASRRPAGSAPAVKASPGTRRRAPGRRARRPCRSSTSSSPLSTSSSMTASSSTPARAAV